jgi:hypothetical protein
MRVGPKGLTRQIPEKTVRKVTKLHKDFTMTPYIWGDANRTQTV